MAPHVEDGYVPEPETLQNESKTTTNGHSAKETLNSSMEHGTSNGQTATSEEFTPKAPLKLKGVLDQFQSFDVTPVIGKEFENVDLVEWLRAPNSDELLQDLATTSQHISISTPAKHTYAKALISPQSPNAASSSSARKTV